MIYLSLAFSETEHLIALTGMSNHNKLQVWYWRTKEMLKSQETELLSDQQEISCSSSLPLTVAQFAFKKGRLNVWEAHGTQKFVKLIRRCIRLDFDKIDGPFSNSYTIEGNILISNRHGDIYNVIPSSGSVNLISTWTGEKGNNKSCLTYLRNGILISGPDGTLKFFKKQKYVWNEIFQQTADDIFVTLKSYHDNETVIATTESGGLYKICVNEHDKLNFSKIKQFDSKYKFFAIIYPTGDHFIAVDDENQIFVMKIKTGEKTSKIDVTSSTVVRSNPTYPFIAVGRSTGDVSCISILNPESPVILTEFMLSRRAIVDIRFTDYGNFLMVKDAESNFFIIKSTPGTKMAILHHFKQEIAYRDCFIIESFDKLNIYFLMNNGNESKVMKVIINLYDVDEMKISEYSLNGIFTQILPILNVVDTFFAIRRHSKEFHVLEINADSFKITSTFKTPHQMKQLEGYNDGNFLVTWGIDGIVAIYDVNKKNHPILSTFVGGNRHSFGVKLAHCNARGDLMLTLDHSGNLMCTRLEDFVVNEEIVTLIEQNIEKVNEIFTKPTSGGFPGLSSEYFGKKFTDLKSEEAFQFEALECEETRKILFAKLDDLRRQVSQLLDQNENLNDEEKLPIDSFNLDLKTKALKEREAQLDRDQQEKKMSDFIKAQTNLNEWVIEKCWNPMEVKGAKVRGMFIGMFVENYPLLKKEPNEKELKRINLMRAIENSVARHDEFLPWRPIPTM